MNTLWDKTKKEDLRVLKTRRAVYAALTELLRRHKYARISVHDICRESLVSRTAFYAHFKDKYDLLEKWLTEQRETLRRMFQECSRAEIEDELYEMLRMYSTVIQNLLEDANQEQQDLMYRFFSPRTSQGEQEKNEVLADFLSGGLLRVVYQNAAGNRKVSEAEIREGVRYVYEMLMVILEWDRGHFTAEAR